MTSKNNVQDTHISTQQVRQLHDALVAILIEMNRPQRDEALIQEAGIALDRALFPLLVGIERRGPLGVVDLADGVGRDYTTVSRQVAKLEELGLIERRPSPTDGRSRVAVVTPAGQAMCDRLDVARVEMARRVFRSWDAREVADLIRLMGKFSGAFRDRPDDA